MLRSMDVKWVMGWAHGCSRRSSLSNAFLGVLRDGLVWIRDQFRPATGPNVSSRSSSSSLPCSPSRLISPLPLTVRSSRSAPLFRSHDEPQTGLSFPPEGRSVGVYGRCRTRKSNIPDSEIYLSKCQSQSQPKPKSLQLAFGAEKRFKGRPCGRPVFFYEATQPRFSLESCLPPHPWTAERSSVRVR